MKRTVDYRWRLAELMAARGMHNTTELIPHLAERDITLSRPQVYRLVTQRPERISLQVVAALCDIFDCGPDDELGQGSVACSAQVDAQAAESVCDGGGVEVSSGERAGQ